LPVQESRAEQVDGLADLELKGGKETVLVAEDEELLRRLAKEILEGLGYNVLLAADGEDAVKVFEANRDQIDVVVLDLVMPKLGGRAAYESMRSAGCSVPVIFMTGYSAELAKNTNHQGLGDGFIQKPYSVQSLGQKVREVLDSAHNFRTAG
jgi:CheY-like chemotaxis protein